MNKSDKSRNQYMLQGALKKKGYDWWWHNFTGYHRSTGEAKSFFIEYFVCNPDLGGNQAILGQLPENQRKNRKPSYAMIKVGCWGKDARQVHNFYPITGFSYVPHILDVNIGECTLTEKRMTGCCELSEEEAKLHPEYMSDSGSMAWNLTMDKRISYHVGYGASAPFRAMNAFEMFWHAEGIKTLYSGEVIWNNEIYDVIPEKSYGYADKNWGSDFTSPWLWISSCNLRSIKTGKELNNSAVEFGGGKPKVFGVEMDRKLLGGLYYQGKMYDYNFSKFWTRASIKFKFEEGSSMNVWKLRAENRTSKLEMILKCPKEEMLLVNYEAPNGRKLHNRLWNGGTGVGRMKLYEKNSHGLKLIDEIEMRNTGCEYGEYGEFQ